MASKKNRLMAIQEILQKEAIADQSKLVSLLKDHYNIATTQTAISRDFRQLGVIKREVKGKLIYELPSTSPTEIILKEAVLSVDYNEAMIVIHTFPALADFLGDYLDACDDLPILGCVSGENTVFVAPKKISKIKEAYQILCQKVGYKK